MGHCPNLEGGRPMSNLIFTLFQKQKLPKLCAEGGGILAMLKEKMFFSGKSSFTLQKKINPNRESQKGGASQQRPMLWRTGPRGESPHTSSEIHIEGHSYSFHQKPLKIWGLWPCKTRPSKECKSLIWILIFVFPVLICYRKRRLQQLWQIFNYSGNFSSYRQCIITNALQRQC